MTSEINVKDKDVVVPGEVLACGMDFLPANGTYRKDDKIIAEKVGVVKVDGKVLKIIPLSGRYFPKYDDTIICQVIDVLMSGWRFDINSAYSAMLNIKDATSEFIRKDEDLTKIFALDDYVVAMISKVTSQNLVDLSMRAPGLKKIVGGRIIHVNTHKVPRIIGKQGSMVSMIKDATGCKIIVGQNGRIWVGGEPAQELIAMDAIKKIEAEAHTRGLTENIKTFLDERCKK